MTLAVPAAKPTSPAYLDLDALQAEVTMVVKLGGKDHQLKSASVSDFIANTKRLQAMSPAMNFEQEFDALAEMILRSFPSMDRKTLEDMTLIQLNHLLSHAFALNGQESVTGKIAADSTTGNAVAGKQ